VQSVVRFLLSFSHPTRPLSLSKKVGLSVSQGPPLLPPPPPPQNLRKEKKAQTAGAGEIGGQNISIHQMESESRDEEMEAVVGPVFKRGFLLLCTTNTGMATTKGRLHVGGFGGCLSGMLLLLLNTLSVPLRGRKVGGVVGPLCAKTKKGGRIRRAGFYRLKGQADGGLCIRQTEKVPPFVTSEEDQREVVACMSTYLRTIIHSSSPESIGKCMYRQKLIQCLHFSIHADQITDQSTIHYNATTCIL